MAESGTPGGELESIERKGWKSLELQEVSLRSNREERMAESGARGGEHEDQQRGKDGRVWNSRR